MKARPRRGTAFARESVLDLPTANEPKAKRRQQAPTTKTPTSRPTPTDNDANQHPPADTRKHQHRSHQATADQPHVDHPHADQEQTTPTTTTTQAPTSTTAHNDAPNSHPNNAPRCPKRFTLRDRLGKQTTNSTDTYGIPRDASTAPGNPEHFY